MYISSTVGLGKKIYIQNLQEIIRRINFVSEIFVCDWPNSKYSRRYGSADQFIIKPVQIVSAFHLATPKRGSLRYSKLALENIFARQHLIQQCTTASNPNADQGIIRNSAKFFAIFNIQYSSHDLKLLAQNTITALAHQEMPKPK